MRTTLSRRMNLSHTAALALVGWYLMVPPHRLRNGQVLVGVDKSASISKWTIDDSFDTAVGCQDTKWKQIQEAIKARTSNTCAEAPDDHPVKRSDTRVSSAPNATITCFAMAEWEAGQCIATDDPRLKEK
jgi:hypothetical protein